MPSVRSSLSGLDSSGSRASGRSAGSAAPRGAAVARGTEERTVLALVLDLVGRLPAPLGRTERLDDAPDPDADRPPVPRPSLAPGPDRLLDAVADGVPRPPGPPGRAVERPARGPEDSDARPVPPRPARPGSAAARPPRAPGRFEAARSPRAPRSSEAARLPRLPLPRSEPARPPRAPCPSEPARAPRVPAPPLEPARAPRVPAPPLEPARPARVPAPPLEPARPAREPRSSAPGRPSRVTPLLEPARTGLVRGLDAESVRVRSERAELDPARRLVGLEPLVDLELLAEGTCPEPPLRAGPRPEEAARRARSGRPESPALLARRGVTSAPEVP
jgi:hypothetical protein